MFQKTYYKKNDENKVKIQQVFIWPWNCFMKNVLKSATKFT